MKTTILAKDLSKEPPRSPRVRVNGYAMLGRTLDKCRASLAGTIGEYHFDCPLDRMLFDFKGLDGGTFAARVGKGAADEEIAEWLDRSGTARAPAEVSEWSDRMEAGSFRDDPERRDWFAEECGRLGLDPKTATVFDLLEADDAASFK